jgi:hypothetical protein
MPITVVRTPGSPFSYEPIDVDRFVATRAFYRDLSYPEALIPDCRGSESLDSVVGVICSSAEIQKGGLTDRFVPATLPYELRLFVLTVVLNDGNRPTRFGRNPGGRNFNADGNSKATTAAG